MMKAVVIDTHILIWYLFEPNRLSDIAVKTLDDAVNTNSSIYVSTISIIEITYLVEKRRIASEVLTRVKNAIANPYVNLFEVPIDSNIANTVSEIDRLIVPEMPDRIIATTALYLQLPLITRDLKIKNLSNINVIW